MCLLVNYACSRCARTKNQEWEDVCEDVGNGKLYLLCLQYALRGATQPDTWAGCNMCWQFPPFDAGSEELHEVPHKEPKEEPNDGPKEELNKEPNDEAKEETKEDPLQE